jgi:hypothetical protein
MHQGSRCRGVIAALLPQIGARQTAQLLVGRGAASGRRQRSTSRHHLAHTAMV